MRIAVLLAASTLLLSEAVWAQQVPNPLSKDAGNAALPWALTKDMPSIAADGAVLGASNTSAFTAQQILQGSFLVPPGSPEAATYDAMRSIAFAPAGTSTHLVSGISSYVLSDASTVLTGGFPAAVGLFAAGVARGDGAKVWGVNTLLSDTMTGAVSAGTGKALNNEFDFNVSSPNTTILALQLAGSSIAQPASAYGVVLQPLDSGYPTAGTIKWSAFLQANAGSTNIFAGISPKQVSGNSIKSADIVMGYYGSTGTYGNLVLTGSEPGGLEVFSANPFSRAVSITGGAGRFVVQDGGGFVINDRITMQGTGATLGFGQDVNYTTQNYGNAASATTILGSSIKLSTLPASAGGGGLAVCVDTTGTLYKKAACP